MKCTVICTIYQLAFCNAVLKAKFHFLKGCCQGSLKNATFCFEKIHVWNAIDRMTRTRNLLIFRIGIKKLESGLADE